MKEKNKKKQIAKISIFITSIFVILLSVTYAFMTETLTGTKKVTISAGTLSLVLDEKNEITISDGLPMYDQVGMIQEEVFTFDLINETSNPTAYTLKLQKVSTSNELQLSDVKYYLTKDGVGQPALLSSLAADGTVDSGTIAGNDTIEYTLRLWIRDGVTDITAIQGKSLSYKLKVEAGQVNDLVINQPSVDWFIDDNYLEAISLTISPVLDLYFVKLSNEIITTSNILGLDFYIEMNENLTDCGDNCIVEETITQEIIDNAIQVDEETGVLGFGDMLVFAPETVTFNGLTLTAGVWTAAVKSSESDSLIPAINALRIGDLPTITFAGVTKIVNRTSKTMFNYTSEGCIGDMSTGEEVCITAPTNGIYVMEDDDGPSYYYRGNVDNLVKFGSYTKDYYVYRYSGNDFPSLEACKYYSSSCSESNKVLKYAASDNVPMYWRIVRVNGDGTIRMIYAGTSPDAVGQELEIGLSRYNEESNDPKYAGYTYDNTTTKTNSDAKTVIDNWYSNVFEGTTYDSKIATGKFCSDSSGYEYDAIATEMFATDTYTFEGFRRNFASAFGTGNSNPSFKCPTTTDANFGGSYNLKAGLITLDEVVAAGGQFAKNNSYYLYIGVDFWTMSPFDFSGGSSGVGILAENGYIMNYIPHFYFLPIRPVINLKSDVTFKSGTDGSTINPYVVE